MPKTTSHSAISLAPDVMPVLGRGRHRNPRSGACFMEFASYLAGERWSDHPACTHPTLAATARLVNDCSSDSHRSELATMIPSVVGLLGDGRRTSLAITARALSAALPIVSCGRQRALAAGALRMLPLSTPEQAELIQLALSRVPDAREWAGRFVLQTGSPDARSIDRMCDAIIRTAVVGIAEACVSDPDARLRMLLADCIADTASSVREETSERVFATAG